MSQVICHCVSLEAVMTMDMSLDIMMIVYTSGLLWWLSGTESVCQGLIPRFGRSLGWEDPLEEEMATHSSILAWEMPRTEGPGGL